MIPLIWSKAAEDDLDAIINYIAQDNIEAALNTLDEITRQSKRLCDYPLSGREGRIKATRELVVARSPYVIVYTVSETVTLLRILHGAQKWP